MNWYRIVKVGSLTDQEISSLEAPGGRIEQEVHIGGYDLFISSLPFFRGEENMPQYQIGIKREDLDISNPESQLQKQEVKLPQEDFMLIADKMRDQIKQWINQYGPLLIASHNTRRKDQYSNILSYMGFSVKPVNLFGTEMNIVT